MKKIINFVLIVWYNFLISLSIFLVFFTCLNFIILSSVKEKYEIIKFKKPEISVEYIICGIW